MPGMYEDSEMIGAFLDEVEEQLQLLEQGILDLEQNGETPSVIQKIFRAAHTLKGSSAAIGYDKMTSLTHEMENVLDKIRNNSLSINIAIINILFKCLDCLRLLKEGFGENKNDTNIENSELVGELKLILTNQFEDQTLKLPKGDSSEKDNEELAFILNDDGKSIMESALKGGHNCLVCKVKLSEDSFMKATRACLILSDLNELGDVITSEPNVFLLPDDSNVTKINYLLITKMNPEALESKARESFMDVEEVKVASYKIKEVDKKVNKATETSIEISSSDKNKKASRTVRVDIERLEEMMNLVGEMVIEQTRIAQVGNVLHSRYSSDSTIDDLLGISNHVSRVVSELQETVMKARMLPVQQLFNRFPRMIRDLSQSLNKQIDLNLEGGDTEMDRTIIEEITDPLIHIIRNSVDHGIEEPELREKRGKALKGTLKIRAFHQENHVIISIADDGSGLNLEKIKDSAIRKKVITPEKAAALSRSENINLIFETGLSTTENISDVSGRGVGMDIVRSHIDKLNGIIDVETEEGKGTAFTIKLPLTLAILTGLLVKIHQEIYALPMSNIVEIVRIPASEISSVKKQSVVVIRDRIHPLIWLHDYFKLPRKKSTKNIFIVVIGVAEKRFGIVVDKLIGNQEIVVKPLGSYIGKVEGVSGATILGDGSVACILDVVGLSRMISSKIVEENIILNIAEHNNLDVEKIKNSKTFGGN
ncbi:chemotaxis protein CheA [Clostridium magnum]|uniref:Chemotaxis protein CheA n=1 Tax=Clostridium magnum DSM 2767 TaxID=1121326 RepID=A0A162T7H0_9CLOT|nr:chemotaxis protein CheA [Clostridium magnum]KZL92327.1 chemotaxis protein CheA [Clostridium magnum DSM 2767]SHH13232.1 two-component system, chemotaxis family, sensor kinase CheA [Clostridium magnum DSM 2767]